MKTSTRWTIAVVAAVVIGLLLWLWARRDAPQAPAKGEVAVQPAASKPEPKPDAPATPIAEAPLTVTVYFDYNRSDVRPGEAPKLDDFAARLKGRAYDRLDAVGQADRIGSEAFNAALSKRRADAVRDYLAGKGVDAKRIRTDARGEAEPVTGNECRSLGAENRGNRKLIECLQRDRRAEVRLVARP